MNLLEVFREHITCLMTKILGCTQVDMTATFCRHVYLTAHSILLANHNLSHWYDPTLAEDRNGKVSGTVTND